MGMYLAQVGKRGAGQYQQVLPDMQVHFAGDGQVAVGQQVIVAQDAACNAVFNGYDRCISGFRSSCPASNNAENDNAGTIPMSCPKNCQHCCYFVKSACYALYTYPYGAGRYFGSLP